MAATVLVLLNPSAASSATACSQQSVEVTLSSTNSTVYHVVGQLCVNNDLLRGSKTVQVFVSGLTYDHTYFDPTLEPSKYSYVQAAVTRGYSTFNMDRLGVGLSDHPAPELLTLQSHAYVVGQIVAKLRAGTIGSRAFTNVIGVGHSFGAATLQYLAGSSGVAGQIPTLLVLDDFLMVPYLPGLTRLGSTLYPAVNDEMFASSGLPVGYVTTMPKTRDASFYYTAGRQETAVKYDESVKNTGTLTERSSLAGARDSSVTKSIGVPVLLSVGQYDNLLCDEASGLTCASSAAILAREASNFNPKACLTAYVAANAGHSVAYHNSALASFTYANDWVDLYLFGGTKNTDGCVK